MKKRALLLFFLWTLFTVLTTGKIFAQDLTTNKNILFEKFMLGKNEPGSIWYYEDVSGNSLKLTLVEVDTESTITSLVSFVGIYEWMDSNHLKNSTDLNLTFRLQNSSIILQSYNHTLKISYEDEIYSLWEMNPRTLSLNIPFIHDELTLKYINNQTLSISNYRPNTVGGSPIIYSIENDVPIDWFRYIASPEDSYYANCINHVSLMMFDWLYPEGSLFEFKPLNIFNIDDNLTDESLHNIINTYSQSDVYSSKKISESILIDNLKKGLISIVKINPSEIPIKHYTIGNYYTSEPHYVILKGYSETDENKYFSLFNPYTSIETYPEDYTLGKNRIYEVSDIIDSIKSMDSNVYIIKGRKKLTE